MLSLVATLFAGRVRGAAGGEPPPPPVRPATAAPPTLAGEIELGPATGSGTLALGERAPGVFGGTLVVKNVGAGPLRVARVLARHSPQDPRLPAGVTVEWPGGPRTLAPGQELSVAVSWNSAVSRAQELYGHVLVESDAVDARGEPARPAALGLHAEKHGLLGSHVLSLLTFLPLIGMIVIFLAHLCGYRKDENIRWLTLLIMGVNLVLALWVYANFDPSFLKPDGNEGHQFVERAVWIESLGAEYYLGIDGVSVTMVVLTALIFFVGTIASWSVTTQLKGYFAMYNLLSIGVMGTFVTLDLMLFFVFWEVMLLPMYFLIGIWGGPRREYAAIKFFVYTLAGSVLMLLAFIYFYLHVTPTYLVDGQAVEHSLAIPELARVEWTRAGLVLGMSAAKLCWVWLFVAFAIKIPMFPFHTWLPDAHVEAPTAISVILAGVLLKLGTYGILRFNFTLLPVETAWAAPAMAVFGVIGIIYGAFCAFAQSDLKKLVAYSSVSHMGFCLLGLGALTPQGIEACLVQMFNHGLITSMLFTLVGVIYDRVHTREIDKFGGLASEMPLYAAFMGFAFMASLGLPGLSGFWGEALTFIGAFPRYRVLTVLAATGVIVTAAYHLWAIQRMFLGKLKAEWRENKYLAAFAGRFPEINGRELASLAPLALLVLLLGFWPRPLFGVIDKGVLEMHRWVDGGGWTQVASAPRPAPATALAAMLAAPRDR
jgi:NADH-quinone oxidoreductase subunit M